MGRLREAMRFTDKGLCINRAVMCVCLPAIAHLVSTIKCAVKARVSHGQISAKNCHKTVIFALDGHEKKLYSKRPQPLLMTNNSLKGESTIGPTSRSR